VESITWFIYDDIYVIVDFLDEGMPDGTAGNPTVDIEFKLNLKVID